MHVSPKSTYNQKNIREIVRETETADEQRKNEKIRRIKSIKECDHLNNKEDKESCLISFVNISVKSKNFSQYV